MAAMASWNGKTWEVSPKKIMALDGLSTSYRIKKDTNSDAEGSPPTSVRRVELQPLSFETVLSDSVGVDVRAELESWVSLLGASAPFILGGKRFGAASFTLIGISPEETIIDDEGRMRYTKLSLTFEEYGEEAAKNKPAAKSKKPTLNPGIATQATLEDLGLTSALNVTPKPADKVLKKTSAPKHNIMEAY